MHPVTQPHGATRVHTHAVYFKWCQGSDYHNMTWGQSQDPSLDHSPWLFLTFLLDRSFFWVGIQNLASFGIGSVNGLLVSPISQNWQQSSTKSCTIVSWIWNSLPKTTYQIREVVQKLNIRDLLWSVYPKVLATGHERYLKENIANNVDWQKLMRFQVFAFNIFQSHL